MTATGHALIGTLIIAKFTNPFIGFPLAVGSHFLCDMLPHWDAGTHYDKKTSKQLFYEAMLDVAISLVTAYILYTSFLGMSNIYLLALGVFGAQLADYLSFPHVLWKWNIPYFNIFKWSSDIQEKLNHRLDKPWGIVTQVAAVILLYIVLFIIF